MSDNTINLRLIPETEKDPIRTVNFEQGDIIHEFIEMFANKTITGNLEPVYTINNISFTIKR